MVKVKRHHVRKQGGLPIFKNEEHILIDRDDFAEKLYRLRHRFARHSYRLVDLDALMQRLRLDPSTSIGTMTKIRVKDFVFDTRDGRVYAVAVTFCASRGRTQKQLEVEYAGYIPGMHGRMENSERQIIARTVELSRHIHDCLPSMLTPSTERKYDFVTSGRAADPPALPLPQLWNGSRTRKDSRPRCRVPFPFDLLPPEPQSGEPPVRMEALTHRGPCGLDPCEQPCDPAPEDHEPEDRREGGIGDVPSEVLQVRESLCILEELLDLEPVRVPRDAVIRCGGPIVRHEVPRLRCSGRSRGADDPELVAVCGDDHIPFREVPNRTSPSHDGGHVLHGLETDGELNSALLREELDERREREPTVEDEVNRNTHRVEEGSDLIDDERILGALHNRVPDGRERERDRSSPLRLLREHEDLTILEVREIHGDAVTGMHEVERVDERWEHAEEVRGPREPVRLALRGSPVPDDHARVPVQARDGTEGVRGEPEPEPWLPLG